MEYNVFSTNPSILSTGLKSLDVANRVGLGENGVGLGGNGVGVGGTGSDWGGTGLD